MIENPSELLKQISHGVYVIGVRDGERRNAFTAAWVMQVSFDPLLLALSINPEHYSYQLLKAGGICTVNVLGRDQQEIAEHFGRSVSDKMAGFDWHTSITGAPVLSSSLAYFDCRVSHYADAGDHRIAVCEVLAGAVLHPGRPLFYRQTGDMDGSSEFYKV
jgi:flavin reductase (DIM6/NTAB) family NADH-FMN oxidoreductase RutF